MSLSKKQRNFYEILNVDPHATFDELKANYKQLILQCHPDKLQEVGATTVVDRNATVTVDFVAITEAWQTLKDPAKRKLYDAELLLTKFQMHSNIFERLTLADMERHQLIESDDDEDDVVADTRKSETGTAETERIKSTESWYYTYDCRCGGQYIIDESANNEIFKHATTTTTTPRRNSDKHVDDDNEGGGGGGDGVVEVDRPTLSSVESTDCDRCTYAPGTATATADNNETEIIVECNECSLVIVLAASPSSPTSWRR